MFFFRLVSRTKRYKVRGCHDLEEGRLEAGFRKEIVRLPFVLKTCEILQVILYGQSQPGIFHVGEKMRKISLDKERSYKSF